MKRLILFLTVAFTGIAVYSQNTTANQDNTGKSNNDYAKHRLLLDVSSGYSNNIYHDVNKSFIYDHYSLGSAFELKYALFFSRHWGISIGAGLSRFDANATLNIEGMIPHYNDPGFDPSGQRYYDLYYKTNNLVEKQIIYALEAPLQFHYQHSAVKNGIFVSLGAKGYFPVSAQSIFSGGSGALTTNGYEAFMNTWYTDPPHFGDRDVSSSPINVKLNPYSVDAIAEIGEVFRLSRVCDFYVGVYGSYGFMDILPKPADKKDFITSEQNNGFTVNSLLASNYLSKYNQYIKDNNLSWKPADEKWNKWQVGLKIGWHIKFGSKKADKEKSSGKNREIIVRDTIHIVNIINMPPVVQTEGSNLTPHEKESVDTLNELLVNGSILFDLDSDVPKIDTMYFITEAVKILAKEPALRLIIEGYTCELGSEAYNRELAFRRASAIRYLFIKQGANPKQIRTEAYTANDIQSKENITDKSLSAHRVVIYRIEKGK